MDQVCHKEATKCSIMKDYPTFTCENTVIPLRSEAPYGAQGIEGKWN